MNKPRLARRQSDLPNRHNTTLRPPIEGLARIEQRDAKEIVVKTDERSRTIDIHARRHTFGTHLPKAGVPLRTAKAAQQHGGASLTANVYTDPKRLDVAGGAGRWRACRTCRWRCSADQRWRPSQRDDTGDCP